MWNVGDNHSGSNPLSWKLRVWLQHLGIFLVFHRMFIWFLNFTVGRSSSQMIYMIYRFPLIFYPNILTPHWTLDIYIKVYHMSILTCSILCFFSADMHVYIYYIDYRDLPWFTTSSISIPQCSTYLPNVPWILSEFQWSSTSLIACCSVTASPMHTT